MLNKYIWIRKIYLYLFSLVGLVLIIIGIVRLVDLGLKMTIFKDADSYIYYSYPRFAEPPPIKGEGDGKTVPEIESEKQIEIDRKNNEAQVKRERQRTASSALAMILVGFPLYLYHWMIIRKEKE